LLEASNNLSIKTEFDGVNTISISRPRLVDELGSNVGSVEVSKPIGITSQVLNKIEGTVVFTYIVQVKDNDGATVFLEWVDDLSTSDEGVESSIFWTPDTTGAYQVEILVWENVLNPLPLAPIKSIRVVVNG